MRIVLALVILLNFAFEASAQSDTTYQHSRNKAAVFSAILPGAGQIYNEIGHRKVRGRKHISWWRAPIYIAGITYVSYLAYQNASLASDYKSEWLYRNEFGTDKFLFDKFQNITVNKIVDNFQTSAKYRDYAIAGAALIYALNVIDAFVDAHFVTFDVSDDLSLNIRPRYFGGAELGCSLSLHFQ
ncbi:MAG: DUF5683 domain-containing protein [Crocinitomicaceae bacterium]